jgi:hypothetical protein
MKHDIMIETLVSKICQSLEINKLTLARMIDVNESTISSNLSKTISEVSGKKTGKRLLALSYIVLNINADTYSKTAIIEGLNEPTISNVLGFKESVLSAIQNGRAIEPQILLEKTIQGIESYTKKKRKANDSLRSAVQAALMA